MFQYSYFLNHIAENSNLPTETFPNGVTVGQSVNTPQTDRAAQVPVPRRLHLEQGPPRAQGGRELHLRARRSTSRSPPASSRSSRTWPTAAPRRSRTSRSTARSAARAAAASAHDPEQPVRASTCRTPGASTDKLTLDLGLRYDLVTGFAFDQDDNIIFAELQAAAARACSAAAACRAPARASRTSARSPQEDKNNIAPRVGFTYDVKGDGGFVLRGGVGRYYDFAYTNANILFAVIGAQSSFGADLLEQQHARASATPTARSSRSASRCRPTSSRNAAAPLPSHAASPRIKQPYTDQANLGFAKALGNGFAVELDGVYAKGSDLGTRPRLNAAHQRRHTAPPGRASCPRPATPTSASTSRRASATTRASASRSRSAGTASCSCSAGYTLSEATSSDQPARDRRVRRVRRPRRVRSRSRTTRRARPARDIRHRVTISGDLEPGRRVLRSRRSSATSRRSRTTSSPASTPTATARPPTTCRRASTTLQLGARRGLQAVRPARLEEVQPRQPRRPRG